jgi:hypothetical protein
MTAWCDVCYILFGLPAIFVVPALHPCMRESGRAHSSGCTMTDVESRNQQQCCLKHGSFLKGLAWNSRFWAAKRLSQQFVWSVTGPCMPCTNMTCRCRPSLHIPVVKNYSFKLQGRSYDHYVVVVASKARLQPSGSRALACLKHQCSTNQSRQNSTCARNQCCRSSFSAAAYLKDAAAFHGVKSRRSHR